MDLLKLKSGSDIRGTAIVDSGKPPLSNEVVRLFARAFKEHYNLKKVAIGHDSRLSGESLSAAAAEGIMDGGGSVLFCGLSSTPAMFMTTVLNDADGAIMVTASHHPFDKNGLKFFLKSGGLSSKELGAVIDLAIKMQSTPKLWVKNSTKSGQLADYIRHDFLEEYCSHLRAIFIKELGDMPLKGFKVAVDAGHGAAGFYATRILQPLGADISGSQYLSPDGNFPAHAPNPEDKEAMESLSKRVLETKSDLGIIFDPDGDRCAFAGSDGTEIARNRLVALAADMVLRDNPNAYIVTDSITSVGLKEFIEERGGTHVRYKRGYQNVISYAKQLCAEGKNAPLAIETSGHAALKENYFLDDGAYLALKIIILAVNLKREGKSIKQLIADLKEPKEEKSLRIKLSGEDWKQAGEDILRALESLKDKYDLAKDSFEGVRIYTDHGYFTARISVHDPIVPLNIESDEKGGAAKLAKIIYSCIKDIKNVDFSELKALANLS